MPLILCRDQGLTYPQFKCDCCGQRIKNIGTGALLVWDDTFEKDDPAEIIPLIVCPDCEDHVDYGKTPLSIELDTAFVYLQGNSFPNHAAYESAIKKSGILNAI